MNPFEILGIEVNYELDQQYLRQQYLQQQQLYHPDRAATQLQRQEFLAKSMSINDAYKILKDDYLRATILLKLEGYSLADSEVKNILNITQFEEILAMREYLETLREPETLEQFKEQQLAKQQQLVAAISESFEQQNFTKALELTIRLKYLINLIDNIKMKLINANFSN